MGSKGVGSGVWLRWRMYQGSRESKLRLLLLVSTAGVALVVFTLLAYGILQQYCGHPSFHSTVYYTVEDTLEARVATILL